VKVNEYPGNYQAVQESSQVGPYCLTDVCFGLAALNNLIYLESLLFSGETIW